MDNTHLPPGGDEEASRPTEQFWSGPGPSGRPGPGGPAAAPQAHGPSGQAGQDGPGRGGAGPGGPGYGGPGSGQPWPREWPGYHGQPGPEPLQQHYARDRRRAVRWSAGVALVALLAGGGAILGVSLAGNSLPGTPAIPAAASSPAAAAGSVPAGSAGGQAAVLNAALSAASSPAGPAYLDSSGAPVMAVPANGSAVPAAGTPLRRCLAARAAARAAGLRRVAIGIRRACRVRFALRALALRGVHGEYTLRTRNGYKTLAFERGTIQSVSSGKDIVVRAPDGTTWTWDLVSDTVVRESGQKTGTGALGANDQVWVGGPVSGSAKDARLIVIRPASGSAGTAPSPSAS